MHNCACTIFLIVALKIEFPLPSLPSFHGKRSFALGGYEASMGQFDHNLGGITETINGLSMLKYCQVQEFYFHNHSWTQTYTYFYTVDIPHRSPPTNPLTTEPWNQVSHTHSLISHSTLPAAWTSGGPRSGHPAKTWQICMRSSQIIRFQGPPLSVREMLDSASMRASGAWALKGTSNKSNMIHNMSTIALGMKSPNSLCRVPATTTLTLVFNHVAGGILRALPSSHLLFKWPQMGSHSSAQTLWTVCLRKHSAPWAAHLSCLHLDHKLSPRVA